VSEWQPIETALKDGTEILVWDENFGIRRVQWTEFFSGGGFWDTGYASEVDGDPIDANEATHWMPLPDPPKG
jgi:hypothetical protein